MKFGYVGKILESIQKQLSSAFASGDTLAMQIMALTCVKKSIKGKGSEAILEKIEEGINIASTELVNRQLNDISFGENDVTAALASQVSERFHS